MFGRLLRVRWAGPMVHCGMRALKVCYATYQEMKESSTY